MNTVFFGTSDKSKPILEALKEHTSLKLCVTKSDTLVGRKKEKRETEVKKWAKQNDVEFIEVSNLKDQENKVIAALKQAEVEIGVVADFSFMIPLEVIETPKHGLVNVHFSLLPQYRGASPVQHAILNQNELTGITFYLMDKGMDTGAILDQVVYQLRGDETTESLYSTLFELAAQELPHVLEAYVADEITPQEQIDADATYTYSKTKPRATLIDKNDAKIDWSMPAVAIDAAVRAYLPWPVAWTTLAELEKGLNVKLKESSDKDLRVKIYKTTAIDRRLEILELQIEGKNKMDWESFKNGYLLS